MFEPTQARTIPVGILVSVSDARAKPRPKPASTPPLRKSPEQRAAWQQCVALVQAVPWYAVAAAGIALWSIAFVGFACFAKMPEPLFAQAPVAPAEFTPATVFVPVDDPVQALAPEAPVEEIPALPMPEPAPEPIVPPAPEQAEVPVVVASAPERKPEPAVEAPAAPQKPAVCTTNIGTQITFVKDPPEAFKRAREEKKLVFLIHLSGNFEDKEFT